MALPEIDCGILPASMTMEDQILESVLNGTTRIRRFTREEQVGSSDIADRLLWLGILRAESELAEFDRRGMCPGARVAARGSEAPSRFLRTLATPLPSSFAELSAGLGNYEDRGQESVVFDGRDGFVYKVRPMRPSPLSGYLAPLANIVYHNRLFPAERYTLENIFHRNGRYFLVLRQPRVEIALDESGFPLRPSTAEIKKAVAGLGLGLMEWRSGIDSDEQVPSDFHSSESTGGWRDTSLRFYNSDYFISDLQPGRNTVKDMVTGKVRFIDPRITLNDSQGPSTPVSRFGRRRESLPGQDVELEIQSARFYADEPMSEDD